MKRRRIIVISAAVALALVTFLTLAFWPGEKEPEYQGKKLSEWLEMELEHPQESAAAIRAIGTNAIPFLTHLSAYDIPPWKQRVLAFYEKHADRFSNSSANRLAADNTGNLNNLAFRGFVVLGASASNAVPFLAHVIETSTNDARVAWAAGSLAFLGPTAVPPLVRAAGNPVLGDGRRMSVIMALWNTAYLGTNALPCIEVLAKCAGDRNHLIRNMAAASLSTFAATEPAPVTGVSWTNLPPLPELRGAALRAVLEFESTMPHLVQDLLTSGTHDPDAKVREEAQKLLQARTQR
jgi:HEAT repeat protein